MSKKMMKRSLALGALMAFVITGSAWAAETTIGTSGSVNNIADTTVYAGNNTKVNVLGSEINITYPNNYSVYADNGYLENNAAEIYLGEDNTSSITIDNAQIGIIALNNGSVIDIKGAELIINNVTDRAIHVGNNSVPNEFGANGNKTENYDNDASDNARVIISEKTVTRITAPGEAALVAMSQGAITVKGDIYATAEDVIVARGSSNVKINETANDKRIVQLTGNIDFNYNLPTSGTPVDAAVIVNLTNEDSFLDGNIIVTGDDIPEGYDVVTGMKLGLYNKAQWTTDATSFVNNLDLNDGIVNIENGKEGAVTADKVTGTGGTINVDNATANQFVIGEKGDSEGETTPVITVATTNKELALNDLVGVVSTVSTDENNEEVYTNAADFVEKTGGDVYSSEKAAVNANGELGETIKVIDSANVSVNDMVAIGMMSWRAEMNDMNKRMGELRNANGEHGVWVRMVRGESEFNSVKNQYNQYQLGYDEKLSTDPSWTVGVALSYTDAENNFAEGTGESTNKALSIYGSKLNEDGTFVDLIAKYARLENDFKTYSGMGDADYDTNAYSFSAEVGKRIQQGKGLWIEPQVELTYGKVSAVDYVTKNDVAVAQDGMESLVGRVGFSLGKDIEKGNVYARASYLYDFDGETKAVLDGDAVLKNDLGGGWWEVGVGANINLSKATYIYADIEKTFGGEVDTNWQWNLGVRYSF